MARAQSEVGRIIDSDPAEGHGPRSAPRNYLATSIGSIALLVWYSGTSVAGVRAIEEVFSSLRRQPALGPFAFLTVGAPSMDLQIGNDVRVRLARALKEYETNVAAAAIAYEGVGFKATIARSVVTAISVASRTRFPYRVFAKVDPALQWLAATSAGVTDDVIARIKDVLGADSRAVSHR